MYNTITRNIVCKTAMALLLIAAAIPARAQNTRKFTRITDNSALGRFSSFSNPAINGWGTVAFRANLPFAGLPFTQAVYSGNGGALTTIANNSTSGQFRFFSGDPAINMGGTVAFLGSLRLTGSGIFTGNGGPVTTIADNSGGFSRFSEPAINIRGTVAFSAFQNAIGSAIFTGNGGTVTTIADTSGPFSGLVSGLGNGPDLNTGGTVAFLAGLDAGGLGIFTGRANSIAHSGTIAGTAPYPLTVHLSYDGSTLTELITDPVLHVSFSTSYPIDIPATVGGQTAYAGFTGGTGGLGAAQSIQAWQFTSAGGRTDYSRGFAGATGLQLNGSTAIAGSDLLLTDGSGGEAGSAFTTSRVDVTHFETEFTFFLRDSSGIFNPDADGITFTIQGVDPTALGGLGGGLGYGPDHTGGPVGILKSVAVKFDLWDNEGEGFNSTGLYVNGAAPTVPAVDLNGTGIDLRTAKFTLANPVINDGGTVAFRGYDGHLSIFAGSGGTITKVNAVGTSTSSFPSINAGGAVAFVGVTSGGVQAIFTGRPGASNIVIAFGDTLDGSTVIGLAMGRHALNDRGQIAFEAFLADGRRGIYRAEP